MANALYTQLRRDAYNLIKQFGTTTTILTSEDKTIRGMGVIFNANKRDEANTTVVNSNKTVYFQLSGNTAVNLNPGDLVTIGKKNWAIVTVEDITPDASTTVYYKMEVTT